MKSFKTELKLNNCQRTSAHDGQARHAYNWGLAASIEAHKNEEKRPTAIDLHKRLVTEVKAANTWYYEVSKCAVSFKGLGQGISELLHHPGSGISSF